MDDVGAARGELIERLSTSFRRMRKLGRTRARQALAGLDVSMPQIRALDYLSHGPKRVSELSCHMSRGTSAATSMVDRLEKKGCVERTPDPSDRRVVLCRITDAGREALDRVARLGAIQVESAANRLGDDDLRRVVESLELLEDAMSRVEGERPEAPGSPREACGWEAAS